jgi:hypothetical protein
MSDGRPGDAMERLLRERAAAVAVIAGVALGVASLAMNATAMHVGPRPAPSWAAWIALAVMAYAVIFVLVGLPRIAGRNPQLPSLTVGFAYAAAAVLVGWIAAVVGVHRWVLAAGYVACLAILSVLTVRRAR